MLRLESHRRNRPVYTARPGKSGETSHGSGAKRVRKNGLVSRFAAIDWGRMRINGIVLLFCLFWVVLWGRAWHLQMIRGPQLAAEAGRQHTKSELVTGRRGMIFDRNGQVLARSVEARSVYIRPGEIEDAQAVANAMAPILGLNSQDLQTTIATTKRRFLWLKRKVDDYAATSVQKANLAGVGLAREYDRIYPFKHMAGQVLGFVGLDGKGMEGLEYFMEERLGCPPTRQIVQRDATGRRFYLREAGVSEPCGEDLTLTLDAHLQFIAEDAIARAVREYDARWGGAMVVEVESGDILAWAQFPFFNPNAYRDYSPLIYRNRMAADALEPGSTFKPLVMAVALQEKKVSPNTLIDCEKGKWVIKNSVIRDTSPQGLLPASKVIRYSSNIGIAKIGQHLGAPLFHKYMQTLGFGEKTGVPVVESRGILRPSRDWSNSDLLSTSFGQSISVTGLQMAQAYLILLNGGRYRPLRLIREAPAVAQARARIFSETTSRQVMDMMRDVVEEKDGTGKRAQIDGVEAAGKTGTAQKADRRSGTYGSKRLASFVGFLPAKNPRYLILVMVDEPSKNQFGGVVAAPVFKEIASRTLAYTGGFLAEGKAGAPQAEAGGGKRQTRRTRGLLVCGLDAPWLGKPAPMEGKAKIGQMSGQLAKAGSRVPDVMGKTVRNAVELFVRAGIVPELKGNGDRVVRQSPPAGSRWSGGEPGASYILWLSEK